MLVSPVTAYVTGSALRGLKASLARTKADKVVPGGADRFFKTRVAAISGTSATITTCDDGSKFGEVNPSTGVPAPAYSAPANQQYLFETWQMIRLGGHWAISVVSPVTLPDSRAKPCQPLPALDYRPAISRGAAGERDTAAAVSLVAPPRSAAGQAASSRTPHQWRGVRHIHSARRYLRGTVRRARRACLALRFGRRAPRTDEKAELTIAANHGRYTGKCINIRVAQCPLIGMCGKPAAGRRRPGAYSGPEAAGGNSVRAVQGGAVDERGSSVGRLRGRARRQRAAPPPDTVRGRPPAGIQLRSGRSPCAWPPRARPPRRSGPTPRQCRC